MATISKSAAARVQAQASLHHGAGEWLLQRTTSVALVPLGLWFIFSTFSLAGADYEQARAWLGGTFNSTAMILFVVALFWHAQLGVKVIIEDYVHHDGVKLASLMLVNFVVIALGLACIVAVLKVSLGS